MRVLVCGGRDYQNQSRVDAYLNLYHTAGISYLIHGGAKGADRLADRWAVKNNVPVETHFADWDRHGKAAGPIRNRKMLEEGKPDLVIAFPGGRGTANMIAQARQAGVPIEIVEGEPSC